jgi:multidrug resistance protein, MATE family
MIPRTLLSYVGWCIALGGTTALDTFGSQAFTGGSRPTDLSIHFQRCLGLLWILSIPVCFIWAFIEPILLALGQPAQLSSNVQSYLRFLIIGAPGYIGFESLKKYLQCQGKFWTLLLYIYSLKKKNPIKGIMSGSTIALIAVVPINIGLHIGLVHHTNLGLLGAPVALSIVYWIMFLFLVVYTYYSPTHRLNGTWGGFQLSVAFDARGCWSFLKLAVPGIMLVGIEW